MSEPSGVIHDLGYRGYDGPRLGTGAIAVSLFVTGLRHAYGLGRSTRSKVLPFLLLALATAPAIIVVGVVVITGLDELPLTGAGWTNQIQVLVSIFAAAQAPVLFSRDLRHGSIALYAARPLSPTGFALVRWASLATAIWLFTLLPQIVLLVGGLLAGLDTSEQLEWFAKGLLLTALLATMIAGLTGVISSWSLRRGFAVVGSIAVLVVGSAVATSVQYISVEQASGDVGRAAGLFSPFTLFSGAAEVLDAGVVSAAPPHGPLWSTAYLAMPILVTLVCLALLVRRFRRVGGR